MKSIVVTVYLCGESDEYFSDKIMIYKPYSSFRKKFELNNDTDNKEKISSLIEMFLLSAEKEYEKVDQMFIEGMSYKTIYLKTDDALLGFQEDKKIIDVFNFFGYEELEFVFFNVSGASFEFEGYRYTVHPNESIHMYTPHVHVRKCDTVVRYYLDTLKRFSKDKASREFLRDEKKKIIPVLQRNKRKLYRYWNEYINGYIPPMEDEEGRQYFAES